MPANIVRKVTSDLLEFGAVQRPTSASAYGTSIGRSRGRSAWTASGVYVNGLTEDGAAEQAGIEAGDVIVKVASIPVDNVPQLQEQVGKFRPGDQVAVTILRDGREQVRNVQLRSRDGATEVVADAGDKAVVVLGGELARADAEELKALDLEHGVKVRRVNGGKLQQRHPRRLHHHADRPGTCARPEGHRTAAAREVGRCAGGGHLPNGMKAYYGLGM